MSESQWVNHHTLTRNYPPSPLLIEALHFVQNKNRAVDIGAGGLKDTRYLIEQGFSVTVLDREAMSESGKTLPSDRFHYHQSSFVDFEFTQDFFDIASAMFALPFNPPNAFNKVLKEIKNSLVKGGIFAGNFFGIRDEWHGNIGMTFHTKDQIEDLFKDMEILLLSEVEKDSHTADAKPKHWHFFNVIVRK